MKTIYVFDDFSGDTPVHMGNLYVDVIKGSDTPCLITNYLEGK